MKNGICTRCGHPEVIKAVAADYAEDNREKPMAVTADRRWIHAGRNPEYTHGELYTYTCRSCGFTEWYAEEPSEIPIGPDYKTSLLKGQV